MSKKFKHNSIFISIASYRDKELIASILDCIQKAENNKRLFFGICLQDDKDAYYKIKNLTKKYKLNIKTIYIDWKDSRGACWARYLIQQKLYNNQTYYLQLDSHHRFLEQWDEVLIHMLQMKKQEGFSKPILGGYCPKYTIDDNVCDHQPIHMCSFDTFTNDGDLFFKPQTIPDNLIKDTNIPAKFLSGHFIFTEGSFCKDCIYDPNLYFRGEEIALSARAYTHGYDFFHPTFPIVWHYYIRKTENKHWEDHKQQKGFIINTDTLDAKSKNRLQKLLHMSFNDINFGQYNLGKTRSLHEYELYAGLDFANRRVHVKCCDTRNTGLFASTMSEDEWSNGMLMQKTLYIKFPESVISHINTKLHLLILFVKNYQNSLIYRYDFSLDESLRIEKNNLEWNKEIGIETLPAYAFAVPLYKNNTFGPKLKITNIKCL